MLFRHRFAAGLAAALLFTGSVYAVVTSDGFVRRLVRGVVSRTFRGPAHFESAAFTFRDGLVVRGLTVHDPADPLGPPALRVAALRADFGLGVFAGGPRVSAVVLERPAIRLSRRADGTLSAAGLLQEQDADTPASMAPPAVSVEDGTFEFDDPSLVEGTIALTGVTGTIAPAGDAWRAELRANAAELGPIRAAAFLAPGGEVTASIELPALPLDTAVLARIRAPGLSAMPAIGGRGTVKVHGELAWGPGHAPVMSGGAELAGLATSIRLPGPTTAGGDAAPVEVRVAAGRAEMRGDSVEITGLEVHALGATIRCDSATLAGLGPGGSPAVAARIYVGGLEIGPGLAAHLPDSVSRVLDAFGLSAHVEADVRFAGPLTSPAIDVQASVERGRLRYDGYRRPDGSRQGFAWEVTDLAGTASFTLGGEAVPASPAGEPPVQRPAHVAFTVNGRHGPAKVYAKGSLDYGTGDEIPDVTIVAEDVPLDDDLRAAFQDRAEKSFDRWSPSGTAARIDVRVIRDPHEDGPYGEATEITLHLDGRAALRPHLLPAQLSDVRGRIRVLYPSSGTHRFERVELIGVRAKGDGLAVRVDGRVDSDRSIGTDDLVVEIDAADLGGALRSGVNDSTEFIPGSVRRLFDDLDPHGPAAVRAIVAGDPDRRRDRVIVGMRGVSVRGYRDVPFAVREMTGTVTWEGDEALLDGIEGRALGAAIRGGGRLTGLSGGSVETDLVVEATDLPLGEPLREALGPLAAKAAVFWERMGPSRSPEDTATLADAVLALRPSSHGEPVELWLRRIRGTLRPAGLRFECTDGEFDYDGHTADLRVDATIGSASVMIESAHYDVETGKLDVAADTRGLRFPEDIASLFSQETVAEIEAAFPSRVLHASALRLAYDPGPERLDISGELEIRPRFADREPGPGLEPDGAFDIDRATIWFPPGLPVAFDGSFRAEGFRFRPGVQVEDFTGTIALAGRIDPDGVEIGAVTEGASLVVAGQRLVDATIEAGTSDRGARATATATLHGGKLTARYGPGSARVAYAGEIHLRGADVSKFAPGSEVKGIADGDVTFRNPTGDAAALQGSVEITVREGDLVRYPVISAILNLIPGAGNLSDAFLAGSFDGPAVKLRDLVMRGPVLSLGSGRGRIGLDGTLDVTLKPGGPVISQLAFLTQSVIAIGGTLQKPDATVKPFTGGN